MADLVAIDPEPVGKDAVVYLEHLLKKARAGKLSCVAVAYVYRDGSTGSGWSQSQNLASIIGAVSGLHGKLVKELING